MHHSTPTKLSDLPVALLAQILSYLPLQQRLKHAAVVSSDWAKAATLSVKHLEATTKRLSYDKMDPILAAWLQRHGRQLLTLFLKRQANSYANLRVLIQLPWPQLSGLQCLKLQSNRLPLISCSHEAATTVTSSQGGSLSSSAPAPVLPNLQQLELSSCELASTDCLIKLAGSPRLTSLVFYLSFTGSHNVWGWGWQRRSLDVDAVMSSLLQRLPCLVVLQVGFEGNSFQPAKFTSRPLNHTSSLQHLQDLHLSASCTDASCFESLPKSLTKLRLTDSRQWHTTHATGSDHPTLPPQLTQLSCLQDLRLERCWLLPGVLTSFPLTYLGISLCALLPSVATTRTKQTQAATAAFLSAVRCLTQLRDLSVQDMSLDAQQEGAALQQFAALTASSPHLTALCLGEDESPALPAGALQEMFPAGRVFGGLRRLSLYHACLNGHEPGYVDIDDLARMFYSCPKLDTLDICGVVFPDVDDLSVLLQLPASCSSLCIGGSVFADDSVGLLTQLTQLTSLSWEFSPHLTDCGLEALTAMRGLQRLFVNDCWGLSRVLGGGGDGDGNDSDVCDDCVETHVELVGDEDKVRCGGGKCQDAWGALCVPVTASWLVASDARTTLLAHTPDISADECGVPLLPTTVACVSTVLLPMRQGPVWQQLQDLCDSSPVCVRARQEAAAAAAGTV